MQLVHVSEGTLFAEFAFLAFPEFANRPMPVSAFAFRFVALAFFAPLVAGRTVRFARR